MLPWRLFVCIAADTDAADYYCCTAADVLSLLTQLLLLMTQILTAGTDTNAATDTDN